MASAGTVNESKALPPPGEMLEEGLSEIVASEHDKPQVTPAFTLRVKPDRRRVQIPIPVGSIDVDRARSLADQARHILFVFETGVFE